MFTVVLWYGAGQKGYRFPTNEQQAVRSEFHRQQSFGGWQPHYKQGSWNFHGVCTRNCGEVFGRPKALELAKVMLFVRQ